MSFGGTVFAMIQSLRANARPKHHAFQSWEKSDRLIFKNKYKLVSKQVSPEKLKQVKAKFKKEIEKEQKRSLRITIATIVIFIPLVSFAIFQFFFNNSQKNYNPYISQKDKQITTEINTDQINYLLNSGYDWLNQKHYKNAKFQFNRVLESNPKNKAALFGLTASYVYECQTDKTNYYKATKMLEDYISKFGSDASTDTLNAILKNVN
ncbi:hypothetical protein [uncultured Draconibacterium sp.]|uniref:hypothetical protein n=1 Tax=uncultured Draconibacterium sp. TaxID=1573823 RepID=UPI0032170C9F